MKGSTILQLLTLLICAGLLYNGFKTEKEIERLHTENRVLMEKIDSLQQVPAIPVAQAAPITPVASVTPVAPVVSTNPARQTAKTVSKAAGTQAVSEKKAQSQPVVQKSETEKSSAESLVDEIISDLHKEYKELKAESKKKEAAPKLEVNASYRIEDRYTESRLYMPEIMARDAGVVVVKITIDIIGSVIKTSVDDATTITDEEVIDACRKAALKTRFNLNSSAPERQEGKITYTFKYR